MLIVDWSIPVKLPHRIGDLEMPLSGLTGFPLLPHRIGDLEKMESEDE